MPIALHSDNRPLIIQLLLTYKHKFAKQTIKHFMSEVKVVNRDFSFNASELEDASSAVSEEIEKEKTPEENTNGPGC